ncbi:uncharacterized protein RHOBADRAFT_47095 [Rhodotorula graminis WP1]|uniref:FAM192A/Fyv6 N-terminal domain-containing protein n=1 Tax=Rhodotorula graminis (strain WP1) TaxID=578459 RepID=A0A0P9EYG8_RHOGW|nr:uncharacterized protein RHOBADRAFT_47095 [Rhodotorula graminis WP1]KPV72252.1 hypothetical protein RHOBADRAFT_47095 [Rhodotorula graminis WP1]
MSDAPSALGTGGVASRFVSSAALEEAKQRREAEFKAAYARIGEEPPKQEDDGTYDPRSLFEKLQENKSKKQEAFEEQLKFKNHFRALDEDEISFLDSMIEDTNEEEREKKRLELEELKGFRAAVHKRVAPAPPPAAAALSLSPPLPAASTSALPPTASAPTSTSTSASVAAPKPAATVPKKGKRKTLPGLVVKKKPAAATPSAAAPASAGQNGDATAAASTGGAGPAKEEAGSAGSSAAASAGSKRGVGDRAGPGSAAKEEGATAAGAEREGDGEGAAKKRRVDEGAA